MSVKCYSCHSELDMKAGSQIGRSEECNKCSASLRCCRMCTFYDTTAYNSCRETSAERILEKEKANFCDYFQFGSGDTYLQEKDSLISAADALFKK